MAVHVARFMLMPGFGSCSSLHRVRRHEMKRLSMRDTCEWRSHTTCSTASPRALVCACRYHRATPRHFLTHPSKSLATLSDLVLGLIMRSSYRMTVGVGLTRRGLNIFFTYGRVKKVSGAPNSHRCSAPKSGVSYKGARRVSQTFCTEPVGGELVLFQAVYSLAQRLHEPKTIRLSLPPSPSSCL